MDIMFINRDGELINARNLSIKVMNSSLIGIDAEKNIVCIERFNNEKEAKEALKGVIKEIKEKFVVQDRILIRFEEKE